MRKLNTKNAFHCANAALRKRLNNGHGRNPREKMKALTIYFFWRCLVCVWTDFQNYLWYCRMRRQLHGHWQVVQWLRNCLPWCRRHQGDIDREACMRPRRRRYRSNFSHCCYLCFQLVYACLELSFCVSSGWGTWTYFGS